MIPLLYLILCIFMNYKDLWWEHLEGEMASRNSMLVTIMWALAFCGFQKQESSAY